MKSYVFGFWLAGSNLLSLLSSNPTITQIAADETLIRNTVVRQQGNVTFIEGGTSSGANLFHSFGSFSVTTGATAFFDNSLDIQNIISRVTGKSISNNDITATGANPQLNGTVQINTPDIDPTRGLTELPVEVVDRSRLIAQACPAYKGNSFIITGRSSLPSSPREALRSNQTATFDWVSIRGQSREVSSNNQQSIIKDIKSKIPNPIIEANGWKVNKSGEVQLIASAPPKRLDLINTNSPISRLSACTSNLDLRNENEIHTLSRHEFIPPIPLKKGGLSKSY